MDTDGTLSANSNTRIPSQRAVKTYADTKAAFSSGVFASKPAGPAAGTMYLATDLGTGIVIIYTGSKWKPLGGRAIIAQSGVPGTFHTGNTNETNVLTITIPAGLLSANGGLELDTMWGMTGTANTKTTRTKISATSGTAGTNVHSVGNGNTTLNVLRKTIIFNNNATNSQAFNSSANSIGYNVGTVANGTAAIDTTATLYLNFTAQLADGGDSCGVAGYTLSWTEP